MPAGVERKKSALERFFEWAHNSKPADTVLTEIEKRSQGNEAKREAWEELEAGEKGGTPTPTPKPTPSPTPEPYFRPVVRNKRK